MKKPVLLFALKCSVIIYFAACTNIQTLSVSPSVTKLVTKGAWKVNCYSNANTDNTCNFKDYTFTFDVSGSVVAVKDSVSYTGNWLEDNISKKITINFSKSNPVLNELTDYWDITAISDAGISFEKTTDRDTEKFYITAL
jgi:hypothetical protein